MNALTGTSSGLAGAAAAGSGALESDKYKIEHVFVFQVDSKLERPFRRIADTFLKISYHWAESFRIIGCGLAAYLVLLGTSKLIETIKQPRGTSNNDYSDNLSKPTKKSSKSKDSSSSNSSSSSSSSKSKKKSGGGSSSSSSSGNEKATTDASETTTSATAATEATTTNEAAIITPTSAASAGGDGISTMNEGQRQDEGDERKNLFGFIILWVLLIILGTFFQQEPEVHRQPLEALSGSMSRIIILGYCMQIRVTAGPRT